jgi:hypothetical protein
MLENYDQRPHIPIDRKSRKTTSSQFMEISSYKNLRNTELRPSKSRENSNSLYKVSRTSRSYGRPCVLKKPKENILQGNEKFLYKQEMFPDSFEHLKKVNENNEENTDKKISFSKLISNVSNAESNFDYSLAHHPNIAAFLTYPEKKEDQEIQNRSLFSLAVRYSMEFKVYFL